MPENEHKREPFELCAVVDENGDLQFLEDGLVLIFVTLGQALDFFQKQPEPPEHINVMAVKVEATDDPSMAFMPSVVDAVYQHLRAKKDA